MKNLVYIGNKLSSNGKTATTIETLGANLEAEGFKVNYASTYHNIFFRCIDMLWTVFVNRKTVDYVLIDTYSTLNFYYAYVVSQLCVWLKLKYIPILHGGNLPERLRRNPKLSASVFNNAFVNVAPSSFIKLKFNQLNISNIKVIPNSIHINHYPFKKRSVNKIDLLWVRSFSEIYNPKLAVDLLRLLKDKGLEASLCMVGPDNDGSLKATKAYAKSLNVSVTFTGKLTKAQWVKLSCNYSIFINTTNFDNTPVSVIEAMALGVPVISTSVGGIPFLIEDEMEGLLVPSNNVNAFLESVLMLSNDEKLVRTITHLARRKVETFDWQVVSKAWISTLV